jgi:plasmid stabilization system protein ParE
MIRRFIVRPEAEEDLERAVRWYHEQRAGLEFDLILCVEEAFERIRNDPLAYALVYRDARQVLVRRFPYVVSYVVDGDRIAVIAVSHGRRDPEHWKSRVED